MEFLAEKAEIFEKVQTLREYLDTYQKKGDPSKPITKRLQEAQAHLQSQQR